VTVRFFPVIASFFPATTRGYFARWRGQNEFCPPPFSCGFFFFLFLCRVSDPGFYPGVAAFFPRIKCVFLSSVFFSPTVACIPRPSLTPFLASLRTLAFVPLAFPFPTLKQGIFFFSQNPPLLVATRAFQVHVREHFNLVFEPVSRFLTGFPIHFGASPDVCSPF